MTEGRLSNKEFSEQDKVFKKACWLVDTVPSVRQASKFRRGKGSAFGMKREAVIKVREAQMGGGDL